jgi:hypothetical protein
VGASAIAMLYPIGSDLAPCRAGWGCRHLLCFRVLLPWNGRWLGAPTPTQTLRFLVREGEGARIRLLFCFRLLLLRLTVLRPVLHARSFGWMCALRPGRVCFGSSRCGVVGRAVFASSCDCVFSLSLRKRCSECYVRVNLHRYLIRRPSAVSVLRWWTVCATLLQLTVDMEWS